MPLRPPFPGAPWNAPKADKGASSTLPSAQLLATVPEASPVKIGPWNRWAHGEVLSNLSPPAGPPTTTGAPEGLPLIPRMPGIDPKLRRFTEQVSSVHNSLVRSGELDQLDSSTWHIDVAAALGYTPLGGSNTITLSGDVTGSGTSAIVTTIADNAVTYGKIQLVAGRRILGNNSPGTSTVSELSISAVLRLLRPSPLTIENGSLIVYSTDFSILPPGAVNTVLTAHGASTDLTWEAAAGAAGSTGYIQFNTSGAFDAEANLFWDKANDRLGVGTSAPSCSIHSTSVIGSSGGAFASFLTTGVSMGQDTASGTGWIQEGVGLLSLNPLGGNIVVGGTANTGYAFSIVASANAAFYIKSMTATSAWAGFLMEAKDSGGTARVGSSIFAQGGTSQSNSGLAIWEFDAQNLGILLRSNSLNTCKVNTDGTVQVLEGGSTSYARLGGAIFDHLADAATTHTDGTEDTLYTDTTPASSLGTNGDKFTAVYALITVAHATATRRVQAYFAGTLVMDSGTLTTASAATLAIYLTIIRESSTVVRVLAELVLTGITFQPTETYTRITGLTLSGTNILKVTGIAAGVGAAASDIVAKMGSIQWQGAA